MADILICDNCGEEITENPIRRGQRVYCSEACAFEATRSSDCSGRSDISQVTYSAEQIRQPGKVLVAPAAIAVALQDGLVAELSAIEVYGQHIRAIQQADIVEGLQGILKVEQGHARDLAARIRALGGEPVEASAAVIQGRAIGAQTAAGTATQMLQLDLTEEEKVIQYYRAQLAAIMGDEETAAMLKRHLDDETAHAQWLRGKIAALAGR